MLIARIIVVVVSAGERPGEGGQRRTAGQTRQAGPGRPDLQPIQARPIRETTT